MIRTRRATHEVQRGTTAVIVNHLPAAAGSRIAGDGKVADAKSGGGANAGADVG